MASLITSISLIKGESSDIYTFSCDDFPTFDSNWKANLVIRKDSINGTVVLERELPKNDGSDGNPVDSRFVFQLIPSESDALDVGKYFVFIEVRNDIIQFNKEIVQASLSIKASGI